MNKDEISLLKHIVEIGNSQCNPDRNGFARLCSDRKCPLFDVCKRMCTDIPARAKEAQRLLNLHTSIIAEEGTC